MFQSTSFKPFDLYVDLLMVLRKTKKNRNSFRGLTLNKDTFNGIFIFYLLLQLQNIWFDCDFGLNGSSSSSLSRRLGCNINRTIYFLAFYIMNVHGQ